MVKKAKKQIMQQVQIGLLGGTAGAIGTQIPGGHGVALTRTSVHLADWAAPMATVTGAGMAVRSLDMLPKPRRKRRRK